MSVSKFYGTNSVSCYWQKKIFGKHFLPEKNFSRKMFSAAPRTEKKYLDYKKNP